MTTEHKSYLAEKIILHFALLFISGFINGVPIISIFIIMWLRYFVTGAVNPLADESVDMIVMLPISSLYTDFFIIKTLVLYNRGMIKSRFLYFMKLFIIYYIFITILIIMTTSLIVENNAFYELTVLAKFFLFYGINYFVALLFIIIYFLKNKEYFRIQNMLID